MTIPYTFADPYFFYFLAIIPILIIWYWIYSKGQRAELKISSLEGFENYKPSIRQRLVHLPFVFKIIAMVFLIIALARPQTSSREQKIFSEGIDIILTVDLSASMLAEDLKPNRIEAAKKVAKQFIESRPNDRIGLIVFSGESFTQCPLTSDHSVLMNLMDGLKSGQLEDGTAIGDGLATSVSRIKTSKAKSKVIILLTDGVNNSGSLAPLTAAEIAQAFDIRVYTIGVGTRGYAPYPFQTPYGTRYQNQKVDIDEPTMQKIAKQTGGKYFRATSNQKLKAIYEEIDQLEKTKIEVSEFRKHSEEFLPFALAAAGFLFLSFFLQTTSFRSIP